MITFNHFNFNVLDLDRSLAFYKEALNLSPAREKDAQDGSFKLVYLADEAGSPFQLGPDRALQPGRVRVPSGVPHRGV